ncbi:MAG: HAD family phosphatase [Deltaproteobacteria bacterium]|nr:HAD family phosphatase [Deltaproteobacteria bacterium]
MSRGDGRRRLFISDLDGTLLRSDLSISTDDVETLDSLGREGIVRVLATGRSIYTFRRVISLDFPADYFIFSTGAGIARHPQGSILRQMGLDAEAVARAVRVLLSLGSNFMIHRPIPDNHRFGYYQANDQNPDFMRRIELYGQFCWPLDGDPAAFGPATQLVAMAPYGGEGSLVSAEKSLKDQLPGFNVIRATSPLDLQSTWFEIFPPGASKGLAVAWLADSLGIAQQDALAVGNDYNDIDLLEWSGQAFVVANAPTELRGRFPVVASNEKGGVAEAIGRWRDGHRRPIR